MPTSSSDALKPTSLNALPTQGHVGKVQSQRGCCRGPSLPRGSLLSLPSPRPKTTKQNSVQRQTFPPFSATVRLRVSDSGIHVCV